MKKHLPNNHDDDKKTVENRTNRTYNNDKRDLFIRQRDMYRKSTYIAPRHPQKNI